MKKVYIFLANGFEEVEALTVTDLLWRAGLDLKMISVMKELEVSGSHNIIVKADMMIEDIKEDADMIVLPGGIPGTPNLKACAPLAEMIKKYNSSGRYLAAICAAPTVYAEMGLLNGKKAVCYPGCEKGLDKVLWGEEKVQVSDNFITSRGVGTAIDFALKLIELLIDKETAEDIADKIVYK